jgi:ubiquinone/menaquinone biosynthesis C-methylase UbiE
MWNDAAGYETYVGHWSRAIAPPFLAWLALPVALEWLDVGCGTGALTSAILAHCEPQEVVGLDASDDYLASAQGRCQDARVRFVLGNASAQSFPSTSFDVSVSGLVLNFVASDRALAEQHRVLRPGGMISAYVWDYAANTNSRAAFGTLRPASIDVPLLMTPGAKPRSVAKHISGNHC